MLRSIRSMATSHPADAEQRPRPEARVAQGARARVAELSAPEGADARAEPPHRVRGGALPEHRRVLEPRHGDVHDSRRRLHARLRLLRRRRTAVPAPSTPRSRRASPTPSRRSASTTSSSRRSIATMCRTAARRSSPRRSARRARACPHCRIEVLIPDFQGNEAALHDRARRAAGHPESQHRDRAAALSHGALRRPVHAHAANCWIARGATRRPSRPRPD